MTENGAGIESSIKIILEQQVYPNAGSAGEHRQLVFQNMRGDGSSRKFIRVMNSQRSICIAVLPPSENDRDMAEFRAAVQIGRHLDKVGISVPEILAVDERIGLILFEDLGDTRLHDMLKDDRKQALELYRQVIEELVQLQVKGFRGFDQNWCYDTAVYDSDVMLNRESGYFLNAFWRDTIQGEPVEGLAEELVDIAAHVMRYSELRFLHRDFQSRNIMIYNGRIGIIDFQAGRLGPPGYDLASLLIDPYAALSEQEQEELFSLYIHDMKLYPEINIDNVIRSYPYLALQRNLQIIGAFAFLSRKMQKPFFRPYIAPSLTMLQQRLKESVFQPYERLQKTVSTAITRFNENVR